MKKKYDNEIAEINHKIALGDIETQKLDRKIDNILLLLRLQSFDIKPYEKILSKIQYFNRWASEPDFTYLDIYKNFMYNKDINNKYLTEHAKQLQAFFDKINEIDKAKELLNPIE